MNIAEVGQMFSAMAEGRHNALKELRDYVSALQPGLSATAQQHAIGASYGHRMCRDHIIAKIDELLD